MERGYIFPNKELEDQVLEEFYKTEQNSKAFAYVVYIDTYTPIQMRSDVKHILRTISEIESDRSASELISEVILYCKNTPEQSLIKELEKLGEKLTSLQLRNTIMTTKRAIPMLLPLLAFMPKADVTLISQISENKGHFFQKRVEILLDKLIELEQNVTVNVKLKQHDTPRLHLLMNYFISQGWPFLDNFNCILEPSSNRGCIFGYYYSSDLVFTKKIFQIFKRFPQTEFFSMDRWIGISCIHNLIWKGILAYPSSHFCNASKGLILFTGTGDTFPCLRMAETMGGSRERKANELRAFAQKRQETLIRCQACSLILSCGGGCIYTALKCRKSERACCPPVKQLMELSLEMNFEELIEKTKFSDRKRAITL